LYFNWIKGWASCPTKVYSWTKKDLPFWGTIRQVEIVKEELSIPDISIVILVCSLPQLRG
jgi:hypothetical protein